MYEILVKAARIMKLTALFFFIALMNVYAVGKAQNVSLSLKNGSLEQVFKELQKQTGVKFLYNPEMMTRAAPVSIEARNEPIGTVLDKCFKDQPLTYTIFENNIVVKEKEPSFLDRIKAVFSRITVRGTVTDEKGQVMSGVTVHEKGANNGVNTEADGSFVLTVTDNALIEFSYIGYENLQLTAKQLIGMKTVRLHLINLSMNEVVVNKGYYTTSQALNTGNVSSVNSQTIEQQPVNNPLAALEGRVPGLLITQSTGLPGGGFAVQVRGQNSIANGNDPFYVIDGVPYMSSPVLAANNNLNPAGGNPLNFIDPRDIESIEVLKDADATAIYGSRGASGVILITTKKGKIGAPKIGINVYQGAGKITHAPKYVNTPQYIEMRREAFKNDGADPDPGIDYDLFNENGWDSTRTIDWQKVLNGGTAHYTDAQGSISGGNELTQYMVGLGYHRETTVFPGSTSDQKGSLHFNVATSSKDKRFKATLSGNYVYDQTALPVVEPMNQMMFLAPAAPNPLNPDGSLNWANGGWSYGNPFSYFKQPYSGRTTNLVTNMLLSYNITKGLELRTSLGFNNLQFDQTNLYPLSSIDPADGLTSGESEYNTANSRSWIIEPQLNYKLNIGKGQLSALAGTTFQQNFNQGTRLSADNFTSDALLSNLQAASTITVTSVTDITYKYNAVYGRLNYSWEDKYVVNLTARRDGSSRFGPGKQFADFGAVGAAWVFTKEQGLRDKLSFLSFGKLRASYGTSGNDQVADYTFFDRYNSTRYPYGNSQGLYPVSLYNPDLAWEVNKKMEIGVELGFLKDRINFTGSWYRNRSSNQLLGYPLSAVTGFTSITENLPAVVQNTGVEITLSATVVKSADFKWTAALNLTVPRNKLVAYPGLQNSSYRDKFIIGKPITIQRVYKFEGVDPQTGLYQVMGADGKLTSDPIPVTDAISTVNTTPSLYGGLQNSFTYGHFNLDFLFQFVKQTGLYFLYNDPGAYSSYEPVTVLDRWQKPGDKASIQRFSEDGSTNTAFTAGALSDQLYKNASFVRLKNLSFSYTLPSAWQHKLGLQNARIYMQGQNLLTFTPYKGYDPENQSESTLPPLRVWTLGLDITL
jgi:TonB-linked SusC/RagA family outer membrane protein